MKGKKILLLAVVLLVTISFTGCSAKSQLVGKWQLEKTVVNGDPEYGEGAYSNSSDYTECVEYTKDGQYFSEIKYFYSDGEESTRTLGSYSIEDDTLYLKQEHVQKDDEEMKPVEEAYPDLDEDDFKIERQFSVEKNELILKYNDDGDEYLFYYTKID